MNRVRVRTADQPVRRLLVPAAISLGAAFMVGATAVRAQESIDGTWVVDTSIGDISDGSGTFVGFRINEVLERVGEATAVGRTPDVSGSLEASGTIIESFSLVADMTTLATENQLRNGAIGRTLGVDQFPTATFESTEPVDLGALPVEGQVFEVSVPGTLTIKDVSQDIVVDLQAGRGGDTVVVVGSWPIEFADFGIEMPRAPIVVSVEDNGLLEWQIFFTVSDAADGDAIDDGTSDDEPSDDEQSDDATSDDEAAEG